MKRKILIFMVSITVCMINEAFSMDDNLKGEKPMSGSACRKYEGIVTCDEDPQKVLRTPTKPLSPSEGALARFIGEELINYRKNVLGGGAGLAAPQIGIDRSVFIFTSDRTDANLKVVINPTYKPVGNTLVKGEEACFSVPLKCTEVERWEKIEVSYQDLEGMVVNTILDGFAAKAFQHETDHLNGKLTIDHETAHTLSFPNAEAFENHMKKIREQDSKCYNKGD